MSTSKTFEQSILEAALQYIERGWAVFPTYSIDDNGKCNCGTNCGKDAGKHPRTENGLKDASKDKEKILNWFDPARGAPRSNIGIVTGLISGITVIDIDMGQDKFGAESWAEITKKHGEPVTLIARTGSGGLHFFFKYNSALKTAGNVLGKNIDCRNDGGYVIGSPSRHRSGGIYSWDNNEPLADLPPHLSQRKETRGRPRKDDLYRGKKYTLEQIKSMLEVIPADDRDLWRSIGIILGRTYNRVDEAWRIYNEWSDTWSGPKGRGHDAIMYECFYELSQQSSENELTIATIVKNAIENGWVPKSGEVPIENFVFYAEGNNFIYRPNINFWLSAAVDAAVSPVNENGILIKASDWLKMNRLMTSITSDPSIEEELIKGYDCIHGEVIAEKGATLYNTYRGPTIELGDAKLAGPFLYHVQKLFNKPGDADQFLDYMAHRVQRPGEKPRFALLIAGGQGVGKDTAIDMCCPAIGVWNVANIDPAAFEGQFNEFAASVLVRINEAANLHEMNKWAFNERTKVLIAGTPDNVTINPKYGKRYNCRMHCGVLITTNHLASGIYIPEDDRRYDVLETATLEEMKLQDEKERRKYFSTLWDWFLDGGNTHIAAYLNERDISNFSPNNGQRKTAAHKTVVAEGRSGDMWLEEILESFQHPIFLREDWIVAKAVINGEQAKEVRRKLVPTLARLNYIVYPNPANEHNRWSLNENGSAVKVFAKTGTQMGTDITKIDYLKKEAF